jgi:hypothetical protein
MSISTNAQGHRRQERKLYGIVDLDTGRKIVASFGPKTAYLCRKYASTHQFDGTRFSLLHGVQTNSEAHPALYPMGISNHLPQVKVAGA